MKQRNKRLLEDMVIYAGIGVTCAACVLAVIAFASAIAMADPDHTCQGGHNCNDGSDVVVEATVDASSASDSQSSAGVSTKSLGLAMGSPALAECYRTYQFFVFQDSRANPWCMAEALDQRGLHEAASKMRCSIKAVRKLYDSDEACLVENNVSVNNEVIPQEDNSQAKGVSEDIIELNSQLEEQKSIQASSDMKILALQQKLDDMEKSQARARLQSQQKQEAERIYAQQMLEHLREYE